MKATWTGQIVKYAIILMLSLIVSPSHCFAQSPAAPSFASFTDSSGTAHLSWVNNASDYDSIVIFRATNPQMVDSTRVVLSAGTTSFSHGPLPEAMVFYEIYAVKVDSLPGQDTAWIDQFSVAATLNSGPKQDVVWHADCLSNSPISPQNVLVETTMQLGSSYQVPQELNIKQYRENEYIPFEDFELAVYLSKNQSIDTNDLTIYTDIFEVEESYGDFSRTLLGNTASLQLDMPTDSSYAGHYYLIYRLDNQGQIDEISENNTLTQSIYLTNSAVNVTLDSIYVAGDTIENEQVALELHIKNNSNDTIGEVRFNISNIQGGSRFISKLNPNELVIFRDTAVLRTNCSDQGGYVNFTSAFTEEFISTDCYGINYHVHNLYNNLFNDTIADNAFLPAATEVDLSISDLDTRLMTIIPGDLITVPVQIYNSGIDYNSANTPTPLRAYLSANTTLDTSDVLLYDQPIYTNVMSCGSIYQDVSFVAPSSINPNDEHYLIFVINEDEDTTFETNFSNNISRTAQIIVTDNNVDLSISSVELFTSKTTGNMLQGGILITNGGLTKVRGISLSITIKDTNNVVIYSVIEDLYDVFPPLSTIRLKMSDLVDRYNIRESVEAGFDCGGVDNLDLSVSIAPWRWSSSNSNMGSGNWQGNINLQRVPPVSNLEINTSGFAGNRFNYNYTLSVDGAVNGPLRLRAYYSTDPIPSVDDLLVQVNRESFSCDQSSVSNSSSVSFQNRNLSLGAKYFMIFQFDEEDKTQATGSRRKTRIVPFDYGDLRTGGGSGGGSGSGSDDDDPVTYPSSCSEAIAIAGINAAVVPPTVTAQWSAVGQASEYLVTLRNTRTGFQSTKRVSGTTATLDASSSAGYQLSLSVIFPDSSVVACSIINTNLCFGSMVTETGVAKRQVLCNGGVVEIFTRVNSGGNPPYSYSWANSSSSNLSSDSVFNADLDETYWVTITDALGCTAIDTVITPDAPSDAQYAPVIASVTNTGSHFTVTWTKGTLPTGATEIWHKVSYRRQGQGYPFTDAPALYNSLDTFYTIDLGDTCAGDYEFIVRQRYNNGGTRTTSPSSCVEVRAFSVVDGATSCDGNNKQGSATVAVISQVFSVDVFPNPAQNSINILSNESISSVVIYDLQGRLVLEVNTSGDKNEVSLSVENLTPGLYVVRVNSASGEHSIQRLIKN